MQALISDDRVVPLRGQPNLKDAHGVSDVDYRRARALVYALRGTMERTGGRRTPDDGRTVLRPTPSSAGYKFQVWGAYYLWEDAIPLVRQAKRDSRVFRRLLEGDEPTMVDILLAQATLTGILEALIPLGRPS